MNIEIVEDCSPYFMKIKHEGMEEIIQIAKDLVAKENFSCVQANSPDELRYQILTQSSTKQVYELSPFSIIKPPSTYIGVLSVSPNSYYTAHKDGLCNRFGINYYLSVKDDKCTTNWYAEDVGDQYVVANKGAYTRELLEFDSSKHKPVMSTVFREGECVLFNVDIFHDIDNRKSNNHRSLLSLRTINEGDIYFDTVKNLLFG